MSTLLCRQPVIRRDPRHHLDPRRAHLIALRERIWLKGTTLKYHFMNSPTIWSGSEQDKNVVRQAFKRWEAIGISVHFEEVDAPEDAEVRIGFAQGDGSWSYIGRDIIDHVPDHNQRTMNFGWSLTKGGTNGRDTALHEIGHTLGFTHSHQNPNAGIIWNDERVYRTYAQGPNYWDRETVDHNILQKEPEHTVIGSDWDKNSIMQYEFPAGLIMSPEEYQNAELLPEPGLSQTDIDVALEIYGNTHAPTLEYLKICESRRLLVNEGQEIEFLFTPMDTRNHTFQTFGESDTLLVLYRLPIDSNKQIYMQGDDDAGNDYNAQIKEVLQQGEMYLLKLRLYHEERSGETCVMVY